MKHSAATLLIASTIALASCTDRPTNDRAPRAHEARATQSPPAPSSLDDLPEGPPPRSAYLLGRTLVIGERSIRLERKPTRTDQAGSVVALRFEDGTIMRLDTAKVSFRTVTTSSNGGPVVSPSGDFVAWQTVRPGRAQVAIRSAFPRFEQDEQTFPATPSCCDNPFLIHGMTQFGHLFASVSSRAFVWDTAEGQEGSPYTVPDSDDYVREVRGLGRGYLTQVTSNEIVVSYGERWISVGDAADGSYEEAERIRAAAADFSDPRRIVYVPHAGVVRIRQRTSGVSPARHANDARLLDLGDHAVIDLPTLQWEDARRFVVEVSDDSRDSTIRRALVRCDVRSRACQLAARLDRGG